MLVCALATPAPIVWGDDHLGFTTSQAIAGYGALFWTLGAVTTLDSLVGVITRRQALGLAFGISAAAIMLGVWVVSSGGTALGLALIPGVGTVEVVVALGWLAHRHAAVALAMDWRSAATAGATCACAVAACVYLPGPRIFDSRSSGMDLAVVAVLAWLPVVVLARLRTLHARPRPSTSAS
jgi:hypothetical protein